MMGAAVIVSIMKFILKGEVTVDCLIAGLVTAAGSLSDFRIVGCKSAGSAFFPASCHMGQPCGGEIVKK
jgi:hypothetical protein